ncbi:hypothetical protein N7532_009578 [Penicillium argentinense]|uniref:Zn(2)-C6 fungal-type domain-containing protein n=1 Tax=Penicillium argentinense TaxID=1131581 RepID=A0A9W9EZS5_9EURO|nr:uncharacterized protein N7532_009578 [Penicillium argentinense]KAJ5090894.1 hypothetical protein N7532_009578 [Penicillium argentinense]
MDNSLANSPSAELSNDKGSSPGIPQKDVQDPKQSEPKKRTRTGCLNCSRRRRKCDEAKPTCTGCKRRGDKCQWRMLGSFRDANIKVLDSDHPSMSQGVAANKNKRQSRFKILNTLPEQPRTRGTKRPNETSPDRPIRIGFSPSPSTINDDSISAVTSVPEVQNNINTTPGPVGEPSNSVDVGPTLSPPLSGDTSSHSSHHRSHASPHHDHIGPDTSQLSQPGSTSHAPYQTNLRCEFQSQLSGDASPHGYLNSSPEYVIDDLAALRNLTHGPPYHSSVEGSYQTVPSPVFDHSVFSDPADLNNDVFLPGSAYEALHTALRNRQLWTARPDVPTRTSSRESIPQVHTPSAFSDDSFRSGRQPRRSRPGRYFELSPEREHILWQNYLNEICSWLDMFDNNRHFASTFPQMSRTAPHLRYSILALSARQLEREQNEKSQSESLSLYQEAIHLLLPELESKTTPVIASCVILCVLEMLSCNPKEWRRHLDGCAYLIQAAGINGFSGKEEQALFWCFARMDVCGGLISEEETIIPIHNWRPKDMSCSEASHLFLSSNKTNFDTYANYTVYLCAETLSVLFGSSSKTPHPCTSGQSFSDEDGNSYVHRWAELFSHVEQWYEHRPSQMKPIFTVTTPGHTGRDRPFPTVLYGNGDAISGNQLYHVSALLLLQQKPKTLVLSKKPKSVLWHARQICAISASNAHHGCWTNALQPLWIAGKVMSHYSEHEAIVETLVRIERETGWATAWRVEDLKELWGDYDNEDDYDFDMN